MTAKLTVLPGGGEKLVDSCNDCRHSVPHRHLIGAEHLQCYAYAVECQCVRLALQHQACPRFSPPRPPVVRPPRPPGILRRFWRWLW